MGRKQHLPGLPGCVCFSIRQDGRLSSDCLYKQVNLRVQEKEVSFSQNLKYQQEATANSLQVEGNL